MKPNYALAVFIKNPVKSGLLGVWMYRITDIRTDRFTVHCGISNGNPDLYRAERLREMTYDIIPREGVQYEFYEQCENEEAEVLMIPYYMGNSMDHVSHHVGDTTFIFESDMALERIPNTEEYGPRFNDVLGTYTIEKYPYTNFSLGKDHRFTSYVSLVEMRGNYTPLRRI